MSSMSILVVLCQNPFAWRDGGTYAVRASLRKLAQNGEVTVTGFGADFLSTAVGPFRSAGSLGDAITSKSDFARAILLGESYSVRKYSARDSQRRFARIVREHDYSVIWCEKLLASCVVLASRTEWGRDTQPKIVVRLHNIEHALIQHRFAGDSFVKRSLLSLESARLKRYETSLPEFVDQTFTISREDRDVCRTFCRAAEGRIEFLPVPVSTCAEEQPAGINERRTVLFVGDCAWYPNLEAAHWIVNQLAPLLARAAPALRIRIVGRGTERFGAALPNIDAAGFAESLDEEFNCALCSIAPIRFGSGINIKVIESLAHGIPVIGTEFGRRGVTSEAYRTAHGPSEYVRCIKALLENDEGYRQLMKIALRDIAELETCFDKAWNSFRDRVGL